MADRVGQQLGNYRLTRLLGKGGFGVVYQAEHRLLYREQAIKILLEEHFSNPKFLERFLREAQTLAKLDHPNIVHVDELGMEGELVYLVMPYVSGGTLQDLLRQRKGPLGLEETERFLRQICSALGYAHKQGVVHLDLKPLNLLVHQDERLLLSDFGLAHLMEQGAIEGGTSLFFGTPHYMAPEHLDGQPGQGSDLYAVGVMLYQMLAGRLPFEGSTPRAVMMKVVTLPPPSLLEVRPDLPRTLESMLNKALAKTPEERYQTAEELLENFRSACRGHPDQPLTRSSGGADEPTRYVQPAFASTIRAVTPPGVPRDQPIRLAGAIAPKPSPAPLPLLTYRGHAGAICAVTWSPDGKRIASASADATVQVWDAIRGRSIFAYRGHSGPVLAAAWSPDGRQIASGSGDGVVEVWNAASGSKIFGSNSHAMAVYAVAWSPDGQRLASGSSDKKMMVWDVAGRKAYNYSHHSNTISTLMWSPDRRRLASGSYDKTIAVWDIVSGAKISTSQSYSEKVRTLCWSPDSRFIASAGDGKKVALWEVAADITNVTAHAHAESIHAIAWSPYGRLIASASEDKMVQVWEAATGKTLFTYTGHSDAVLAVAWSPDGTRIASAGEDGTVQVWLVG